MTILKVDNISKSFSVEGGIFKKKIGAVHALDGVSFELSTGTAIGIVGESGSGKSTLAKVICRRYAPDKGDIILDGKNLTLYSRYELADKVQMVFQDPFASLNPKLSIGTVLGECAHKSLDNSARTKLIIDTLRLVGMPSNILHDYPHQFSGGQRQRIAIARSLIRKPEILIADEPLSSLDISTQSQLLELFIKLKKELSLSFLFISHDIAAAGVISDSIIVMKEGKIVERGATREILSNAKNEYTKNLLSAVPRM